LSFDTNESGGSGLSSESKDASDLGLSLEFKDASDLSLELKDASNGLSDKNKDDEN
jgi:hypothetical protein